MRFIQILNEEHYRDYLDRDISEHMVTLCDWLYGDAMFLINDDGERFSPAPYYAAMLALKKVVPPNHLNALSGNMYRGIKINDPSNLAPGRIKTAQKQFQSWTPSKAVAEACARDHGTGKGIVFTADIATNRKAIVLSLKDVYDWFTANKNLFAQEYVEQFEHTFEMYAHQDELIVRGTMVHVEKIKNR